MAIPLPVIPNVYRVTLNWGGPVGQHAANVLHFQRNTGTAVDVFNDLDAHVAQAMWQFTMGTFTVQTVDIIKLDGSSGRVEFATGSPLRWTGNGSIGDMIPAAACIVKLSTGARGRANRGRIYMPFVSEAQQANGALVTGNVSTAQTAWNTFLAAMTTAADFLVVASYDRLHGGAGAHATIVNTVTVESECGTQRRRQSRNR